MNLNTYLQQLDLAKLDLQPLNDHYIAEQLNEQEKELYDGALRRRQLRLILGGKMEPNDANELKALFFAPEG